MALGKSIDFLMPRFFLKQFTTVVNIKQSICIYLYSTELDIQHTGAIIIVTIFETFVEFNQFSKDVGGGALVVHGPDALQWS